MPALLTSTSMRPSSARTLSTMRVRSERFVTSVGSASAFRPRLRTSFAVRSALSAFSSATTTSAPRRASSSAVARPMPWPPPVTMATRPPSSLPSRRLTVPEYTAPAARSLARWYARRPMIEGTAEVRDVHRFDVSALERYLSGRVEGFRGPLGVRQFRGGQSNPTYYLEAGGREYVLRRKPPGQPLPSAPAVDREYRVLAALAAHTTVPVPKPYLLCEDDAVIGTMFYVMDCVHGRIFRDANLGGATPAERRAIYDSMNDVLARLHLVDWKAVGLAEFGRPGDYYARQIHRWSQQYRASETEKIEAMERLMEWLPKNIPASAETTLVHGDYRPGNMIVHPSEPRVVAVLDWELSTLGHPMADLAYNCMPYHLGNEWEGMRDAPLAELGIPTEAAYLAAYCRRTRRPAIEHWDFYIAFAEVRLAAIAQGIMGRVVAGTANDPNARERGERARPLAEAGWRLVASRLG